MRVDMPQRTPQRTWRGWLLVAIVAVAAMLPVRIEAAADPFRLAIILSSDQNRCYDPATVKAIRYFTEAEAKRINLSGTTPPIAVTFYDDYEVADSTIAHMREALADPRLVGVIGLASSTRGGKVFAALGEEIRKSEVPFISEISLNSMFASSPNVFAMASTVDNELQVIKRFLRDRGYTRPAFVGLADDAYSTALGDGLAAGTDALTLVSDQRITVKDLKLEEPQAVALAEALKQQAPDVLLLAIQSGAGGKLLKQVMADGTSVPVFVLYGRIKRILDVAGPEPYPAAMFELAREGVPNVYNERLQQQIWHTRGEGWIFEDTPNSATAGWSDGTCTLTKTDGPLHINDERNRRAIGRGLQYRDIVELFGSALASLPKDADFMAARRHVTAALGKLGDGSSVHRGLWQDWSFTSRRTSADDSLVIERTPGSDTLVLAPKQYHRIGDGLRPTSVIYISLDPIRISRVDTNDESFDAEFFLSLRSEDQTIGIADIEFTNAYRSQTSVGRLLQVHQIHDGTAGTDFPEKVKLYKISGKFQFEPELSNYPFDTQRLSVSFQPASTAKPFLIQPPARRLAASDLKIDEWSLLQDYVGSDQDIIPTIDTAAGDRRIVTFYKFNYTWAVKRLAVDFYLRVVVPLAFILLVTYFSVFLHEQRFDSIMAIQVTALLSAIALYLALPKIDSDQTTLSDKVFMMTYAAVSLMIGLSVIKDSRLVKRNKLLHWGVIGLQTIAFPIATTLMIGRLIALSLASEAP